MIVWLYGCALLDVIVFCFSFSHPIFFLEGNMSPQEIEELLIAEAIRLSLQQES